MSRVNNRPKVKVCGITNLDDARMCIEAGADYLGFVFANSSRKVGAAEVQMILAAMPRSFDAVGVFKDMSVDEIVGSINFCSLDIAQLHGIRDAAQLTEIKSRTAKPIMLALVPHGEHWEHDLELAAQNEVDLLLLDARGGYFNWRTTDSLRKLGKPLFLAGGLTQGTVRLAAQIARPDGLDVASGVESAPGRKDLVLVRAFIDAVKGEAGSNARDGMELTTRGRFGAYGLSYGGAYVPETLVEALDELRVAYETARGDPHFDARLKDLLRNYAGRPTPLYFAGRISEQYGAQIWLKREDLLHTGAHKLNNCLGQALLAQRMGKRRVIAETGAGQHGVGTATACALLGLSCVVYMGAVDVERQAPNVQRMKLLGAEVRPVSSGSATLKDATSEAIRDWVTNVGDTYYLIGSTVGPHPYPMLVREFQRVIGREAREQILAQAKRLPDTVVACVGGGSNALGAFYEFLYDPQVELHGVEAAGEGLDARHAATLSRGRPGVLHGAYSYLLQDADGQVAPVHSISAGLDYPGVGPEHSFLKDVGRARYFAVTDAEALAAFQDLARYEGILPALESSHALAHARRLATERPGAMIMVNLSGRGDKDLGVVASMLGVMP